MSDLEPGSVFADRYRIERRIASGGMGAVYEVVHLETNRRRALKVLHPNLVASEDLRNRFRQEARVAAEIESEHIVDVSDAGFDAASESPFLVMELLRGEDVRQRLKRAGPIPPDETIRILFEAALALDKTHKASIVHRDLKPDNLFLAERDHGLPRTKVLDFGIAKVLADGAMSGQTKESLGTPLYMAPEQFLMSANISAATDIFALGLISYTMLTGKPYWLEETLRAGAAVAFAMHACKGPQESAVKRAAVYGVHLPPSYDEWFFRACAPRVENRYQVATAAIIDLAQALGMPMQIEPAPISMSTGAGRITLGTGTNVASVLSNSGLQGLSLSNSGLQGTPLSNSGVQGLPPPRAAFGSIPGTNSPLQTGLTPIGSGLTNAGPTQRKQPFLAIALGAVGTLVVGGLVAYGVMSSSPAQTLPEPAAMSPAVSASAVVPEPVIKPVATNDMQVEPSASASAEAPTTTANVQAQAPAPAPTPTAVSRPTATTTATTKKPAGSGLWNND